MNIKVFRKGDNITKRLKLINNEIYIYRGFVDFCNTSHYDANFEQIHEISVNDYSSVFLFTIFR